jgi:hypothetical protein
VAPVCMSLLRGGELIIAGAMPRQSERADVFVC